MIKKFGMIDSKVISTPMGTNDNLDSDCGGINPYTLMAKLGLVQISGSGPSKDDAWPGQLVRSPAQGVKTDLAIKQDLGRLE